MDPSQTMDSITTFRDPTRIKTTVQFPTGQILECYSTLEEFAEHMVETASLALHFLKTGDMGR